MNLTRSIIMNTVAQVAGQGLSYLLGAISMMLVMRHLGPEIFGAYSLVLVYVGIISGLAELGGQIILVRELNQKPKQSSQIIGNFLLLKLALYFAAFLIGLVLVWLLGYPENMRILLGLGLLTMFVSFPISLGAVFQARLKIWYAAAINIASRVLLIGLVLFMIRLHLGLKMLLLGNIAIAIASALAYWIVVGNQEKPDYSPDYKLIMYLFRQSLPIGLLLVVGGLAFRFDVLLLSKLSNPRSLGLYSAATKYIEWGLLVAAGFMVSQLPVFSQYRSSEPEKVRKLFLLSFDFIGLIVIPASVFVSLNARSIISLISGPAYSDGGTALAVLIWVVLFNLWSTIIYNLFLADHRTKTLMAVYFPVMAFNIIFNYFGIPKYGFMACAIISVLSEVLAIIPLLILLYRWDSLKPNWRPIFSFFLISLVAVIPMYFISEKNLFLRLGIYSVGWLLLGVTTRTIDMDKYRQVVYQIKRPS